MGGGGPSTAPEATQLTKEGRTAERIAMLLRGTSIVFAVISMFPGMRPLEVVCHKLEKAYQGIEGANDAASNLRERVYLLVEFLNTHSETELKHVSSVNAQFSGYVETLASIIEDLRKLFEKIRKGKTVELLFRQFYGNELKNCDKRLTKVVGDFNLVLTKSIHNMLAHQINLSQDIFRAIAERQKEEDDAQAALLTERMQGQPTDAVRRELKLPQDPVNAQNLLRELETLKGETANDDPIHKLYDIVERALKENKPSLPYLIGYFALRNNRNQYMSVNNPATHTVSFCRDYLRNWEIWECWLVKEPNIVAFKSWAFETWLSGRETGKVTKEGTKLLAWEQWAIYVHEITDNGNTAKVSLRSRHGRWLSYEDGGFLGTDKCVQRDHCRDWEIFEMKQFSKIDDNISLQERAGSIFESAKIVGITVHGDRPLREEEFRNKFTDGVFSKFRFPSVKPPVKYVNPMQKQDLLLERLVT